MANAGRKPGAGGIILILLGIAAAVVFILLQESFNSHERDTSGRPFVRGTLFINEVMASNSAAYSDTEGEFYDWVELYSEYTDTIDLSGFKVYRSLNDEGWEFPEGTAIQQGGYLILWFCGETHDGLYLPWRISKKGGDELYLRDENGNLIDKVSVTATETDCSLSRTSEGVWSMSEDITPGFENSAAGRYAYTQTLTDTSVNIVISEVCTKNLLGHTAGDGVPYDWIELYNAGTNTADLTDFYLSDDLSDPRKWQFPETVIKSGEYLVICASGKDCLLNGEIHTSFRLSDASGALTLRNKRGLYVASADYTQPESFATVALIDGSYISTFLSTPGFANTDEGYEAYLKAAGYGTDGLAINEIMLLNDTLLPTDGYRFYDWIELKNTSGSAVELSDYWLSDNEENPYKSRLPQRTLAPGELCIVFLSGEAGASTSMTPHASFKLDNSGEPLILSDKDGICDFVYVHDIPYAYSYGRQKDRYGFFYSPLPTPGAENAAGVREIAVKPFTDTAEGVYEGIDSLSVQLNGEGKIHYTLDGSEPSEESPVYTGALTLTGTSVIRAASFAEGKLPSRIMTSSYIINEGHTFAVMSIVTDPENLWNEETGIYATGLNAAAEYPYTGANYYNDWERAGYVSLFEGDSAEFSLDCGLQLFGQSGRVKPKKSFQLKFKEKYGESHLRCEVFDTRPGITRYDTLVVRSGSQDYNRTTFRDELLTGLADGVTGLLTQAYRPCVLYLNGEYWGIYFIREKIDEDFISQRLNVSTDTVDILRGNSQVVVGDNDSYTSFYYYAKKLDMTVQANYNYVKSQIDIDSYIDYFIAQAYTGNRDLTNVKFYRTTGNDGKWRWIFFDLDYGFDYAYTGHDYTLANIIKEGGTGYENKINNELIRALFANSEFLDLFLTRYGYLLSDVFSSDRVLTRIDEFVSLLEPEQERNAQRWDFKMSSYKWYVSTLREFVSDGGISRTEVLINEAATLFALDEKQVLKYFYPDKFALLYPEEAENSGEEDAVL